ncbi:MAG: hypothetical protein LKJ47_03925 [Bifidobacteriaceae bacterium]|jgi:hypothetical protein|nr:hypothetical protein [Bifidobacteriaceae bacterium]
MVTHTTREASDHAIFSMPAAERLVFDQFIGQSYGQLGPEGLRPAGNYNLETPSDAEYSAAIPVAHI